MRVKTFIFRTLVITSVKISGLVFFLLCICLMLLSGCSEKTGRGRVELLSGMYRLYIIENKDSAGAWRQQEWGKDGDGYIVYDGKGHMAVQITPKGYRDFRWLDEESSINMEKVEAKLDSMTVDELKEATREFSSSYVYFANYSIDDTADIVTHERISASIPVVWSTTVRRAFAFHGDTLILRVLNGNRRLKWIKQK